MGAATRARPLIGVTTSEVRIAERVELTEHGEPPRREMALGMTYMLAVEAAGGLPVVLPPLRQHAIRPLLEQVSGVCLSGGPDISPMTYGADPHPQLGPTEPDLDRFELGVARAADALGLPLLAICRGAQALNVSRGGTLVQHVPDDTTELEHRQTEPGETTTHTVRLAPRSRLAALVGEEPLEVNSFHHQAVQRLGRGLEAVAWSPDGVIEAIEAPRRATLCLGVQWHAESLVSDPRHAALFEALVEGAAARRVLARAARAV